jgi:probable rRNA maturation factor
MAKQSDKPRIIVTDSSGKINKLSAAQFEVDFGGGRRLLFLFPEAGGNDLDIEAIAVSDKATPIINVQPCASNVISLRVDVSNDPSVEGEDASAAAGPMLNLFVQKAVEGVDRINAPKKHQVRRWAQAALLHAVDAEITIRLVGETEGRALNKNYRDKDYATNVLTFAYSGKKIERSEKGKDGSDPVIGDLVLCVPVVVREAGEQGKALDAHFAHLVVHGMLHLQGFDHERKVDVAEMEARERAILGALGYADPYVV